MITNPFVSLDHEGSYTHMGTLYELSSKLRDPKEEEIIFMRLFPHSIL